MQKKSRFVLLAFTAAIFTSALLLFGVQPMFTRMVLPRLGGSPAVWSVAMVFFQSMLLMGYAYAHVLMQARRPTIAVAIHLALLLAAGLTLPLSISQAMGNPPSTGAAAFWLLALFAISIGPPFFALSANNPLLQAWFARTGHRDAKDPYFLYAASNVGSFLALLSYPALLEPTLTLRQQNLIWSTGFGVLVALIALCGFLFLRSPLRGAPGNSFRAAARAPNWITLGRWIFLSAIPSGLLIAVTVHISTDIAAAPLLWVIPLSLYLLTWVLVFQSRPLIPHIWMLRLQPLAIVALIGLLQFRSDIPFMTSLAGHLIAFFVIAMTCHGELAGSRPAPAHLTTFYVSLSAGGMIGGLFAGLVAPYAFSWVAEYPILIVLAALCRPLTGAKNKEHDRAFLAVAAILAVGLLLPGLLGAWKPSDELAQGITAVIVALAAASLLLVREPLKFAVLIAIPLAMIHLYPPDEGRSWSVRSFFGVHKIYDTEDGQFRILMHGTTIHGGQRVRDAEGNRLTGRPEPRTYYHRESGLAQALNALRKRKGGPLRVAVVGLGSGTLACHIQPRENWKFFEIDASIVEIARNSGLFTFVPSCAPNVPIVLGDARLTLVREPDRSYDMIIVDAYTSDSIPIHLATREAMALYKSKLAPGGVAVMHISNRHLELASVIAGIAAANGLKSWRYDGENEPNRDDEYMFSSEVVVAAARAEDIGELAASKDWAALQPDDRRRTWTDDYSNVLGAVLRRYRD